MSVTREALKIRLELYNELLRECDGPQTILAGRRILDITDLKEWLMVRKYLDEISIDRS